MSEAERIEELEAALGQAFNALNVLTKYVEHKPGCPWRPTGKSGACSRRCDLDRVRATTVTPAYTAIRTALAGPATVGGEE